MNRFKRMIPLFALLLAVPGIALADHHGKREHRGDSGRHMERMAERIELTDAQKAQWQAIHENHMPRMRELRTEMIEQRRAMRDEAAAEGASERMQALRSEMAELRAGMRAEVNEILTEEQRAKFAELHEQRAGKEGREHKHMHMREKRGERGYRERQSD